MNLLIKIKELYTKYRQIIAYLFFGVCSTVVNMVCYYAAFDLLQLSNTLSTVIAWFAAVIFAFVTNKAFVFHSHKETIAQSLVELASFFGYRVATGVLDVLIMFLAVDYFGWNGLLWKLISNIIVTVLNYIASKFSVFKKNKE